MSENSSHPRSHNRHPRSSEGGQRNSNGQFRRPEGRHHGDHRPNRPHHAEEESPRSRSSQEQRNEETTASTSGASQNAQDLRVTAEEAIRLASSLCDKLVELKQSTIKTAIAVTKEQIAKAKTDNSDSEKGRTLQLNIGTTAFRLLEGVAKKRGYESVQEYALHEVLKTVRSGIEKRLKK
jgi:hypothetical protein